MSKITIKEFIKELQKYPNQNATINFVANTTNSEDDTFDIEDCEVACMEQDKDWVDSYDIMVYKDNEMHNDECLTELLNKHGKLTIELDCDNEFSNIIVMDEDNNPLRDIKVGGRHYRHENIILQLRQII
jgi:hypothetical protein